MKYLLIIVLSLFTASSAFAAKSVEGEIPKLRPLQPPPEGEYFNASQNVQFLGAPETASDPEALIVPTQAVNTANLGNSKTVQKHSSWFFWQTGPEEVGAGSGAVKNIFFIVFLIAVLGGGLYYFKRAK